MKYTSCDFLDFLYSAERKIKRERKEVKEVMDVMDFCGLTQIQAAAGGVDNRRCFFFILGVTWE